jgi:hypothetical protein
VRRDGAGPLWWGEEWPSLICYFEAGELREARRVPVPAGELCRWCREPIDQGDSGVSMPHVKDAAVVLVLHTHRECLLREVMGPVSHLVARCPCFGGPAEHDPPGRTLREGALELWAWVHRQPVDPPGAFACPRCGAVSRTWEDAEAGYCGACRWWTGDPLLGQVQPPAPN